MGAPRNGGRRGRFDRGVADLELESWHDFVGYVHEYIVSQPEFIWRGQRTAEWQLVSGLDRMLVQKSIASGSDTAQRIRFQHLENFKLASRGRLDPRDLEERDDNTGGRHNADEDRLDTPPVGSELLRREENNWWAVGQHYGLVTPLLDWSTSPFVAAFFAFEEETPRGEKVDRRAIYGLHKRLVSQKSDEIREAHFGGGRAPVIDFIEPLFKDNPRLTSQGGLFTRAPDGMTVSAWTQQVYDRDSDQDAVFLLALSLPDEHREYILRALNRMNINHQSLFPDLYGASSFVNMRLEIESY